MPGARHPLIREPGRTLIIAVLGLAGVGAQAELGAALRPAQPAGRASLNEGPTFLLPEERWGRGSACRDTPGSRSPRVRPFLQGPLIHQLLCQAGTRQGPEPLAVMVLGRSIIKATLPCRC